MARSLAICVGFAGSEMSKRYAEPDRKPLSSSQYAPTMAVVSLIATEPPNNSFAAPSSGRSLKSCRPVVVSKR